MSFLRKSGTDVNTPRAMTSRSILANQSSIWFKPGGIGRSEVQMNLRMSIQKVVDLSGLMGREVVGNHVNLFAARLVDNDVRQERDELRRRVSHWPSCRAPRRSWCRTPRTETACRAESTTKPCRSARPGESGNTGSLRSSAMDRRFLIHTEHRRMRRRVQIQPNDVGAFCSKSGSLVAM